MVLSPGYGHSGNVWPGVVGAHGDTDVLFSQASFWPLELTNCVCVCEFGKWWVTGLISCYQVLIKPSMEHMKGEGKEYLFPALSVAGAGIGPFVYVLSSGECRNKNSCIP